MDYEDAGKKRCIKKEDVRSEYCVNKYNQNLFLG
jgi:hypothetical protein